MELAQLSEKARAGKLSLDEMQGGCFSISNLGGIGGTAFTPIVNSPEVAILGISRGGFEPVYERPGVRAASDAAAVAVLRSPRDRRRRRAPASCAGSPRRSSSRSCWRCRDMRRRVSQVIRHEPRYVRTDSDLPDVRAPVLVLSAVHDIHATRGRRRRARAAMRRRFYAADLGLQVALVDPEVEPGRRLRVSRLHSVEGAAARRQRASPNRAREGVGRRLRRADDRSRQAARVQEQGRRAADERHGSARQAPQDPLPPGHGRVPRRPRRSTIELRRRRRRTR